jgi:uncharacterized protein YtpQ (UPF0354 family)
MTNGNAQPDNEYVEVMNPSQFATYLERRLSIEDAIEILDNQGFQLRVRVNDKEQTIGLADYYQAYARHPEQLDIVMENFISTAKGLTPQRRNNDFATLSGKIYPMLKPIELLVRVRERGLPMLAYREFLAELMITYVIKEEHSIAYINEDHLDHWEVALQDLHSYAIDNLRKLTHEQVEYVVTGEGEQRIFIFNANDSFDATRLLLSDVLSTWASMIPGNLVIGIPNRDFLIGFSDVNPDIVERISMQIQTDVAAHKYGMTDQLFTLVSGEVREYEWE